MKNKTILLGILYILFVSILSAGITIITSHKEMVYNIEENANQIDLIDYDMVFILTPPESIPAPEVQALKDYVLGGGILVLSHDDYPTEFNKQNANDIINHFGINFVDDHLYMNYFLTWNPAMYPHQLTNNMVETKGSTCGKLNVGGSLVGWTNKILTKLESVDKIHTAISEKDVGDGKLVVFGDEFMWENWAWSYQSNEQFLDNILNLITQQEDGILVDNTYAEWDYANSDSWSGFRSKFIGKTWNITFNGEYTYSGSHPPSPGSLPTLPVTLSSFTVQYLNDTPTLCWTTQSETNNLGWNIYRSETDVLEEAIQVNTELIPGAGTTSEPTDYIYEDEIEVISNTEYWYWLESVDYTGGTENYGPITLFIPEDEEEPGSPEIPDIYGLYQNYPNPFNPNTEISFMMKENCIAELSVYNIKGKKISTLFQNKSVTKDELIRTNWDGKDDFGKGVSSGIYLYKLRTNKEDFVRRMILMK